MKIKESQVDDAIIITDLGISESLPFQSKILERQRSIRFYLELSSSLDLRRALALKQSRPFLQHKQQRTIFNYWISRLEKVGWCPLCHNIGTRYKYSSAKFHRALDDAILKEFGVENLMKVASYRDLRNENKTLAAAESVKTPPDKYLYPEERLAIALNNRIYHEGELKLIICHNCTHKVLQGRCLLSGAPVGTVPHMHIFSNQVLDLASYSSIQKAASRRLTNGPIELANLIGVKVPDQSTLLPEATYYSASDISHLGPASKLAAKQAKERIQTVLDALHEKQDCHGELEKIRLELTTSGSALRVDTRKQLISLLTVAYAYLGNIGRLANMSDSKIAPYLISFSEQNGWKFRVPPSVYWDCVKNGYAFITSESNWDEVLYCSIREFTIENLPEIMSRFQNIGRERYSKWDSWFVVGENSAGITDILLEQQGWTLFDFSTNEETHSQLRKNTNPIIRFVIEHFHQSSRYFSNNAFRPRRYDEEETKIFGFILNVMRDAENDVRDTMGIPHIGEGLVSEMELLRHIQDLCPKNKVIHHYKAEWLGAQHIDIYLPEFRIAIEYQGEQHFVVINCWNGESGLAMRQALDAEKRIKCKNAGVTLIEIAYDDTPKRRAEKLLQIPVLPQ